MAEPAPAAAASRWGIVLLGWGAGVVAAFQIGKMPSAIPALRADLDLSLVAAGWVVSMFNVIGLAAGVAVGAAADWLGHRRVILYGLVAMAAGSALGALALGAPAILLARFVEGLGAVVVFVAVPALIVRAADPRHLRLAFGVWGTYMPAGMAFMVLLTPPIVAAAGWRGLWLLNAVLLMGFALWLSAATRDLAGGANGRPKRGLARVLAGLGRDIQRTLAAPGPVLLALCFATYTGNFLAVFAFLPTFLIEDRGVGGGAAAALTAFAIAINVVGNLAGGWLLHRGAARWLLIAVAAAVMGLASPGIYAEALGLLPRYLLCLLFSAVGGMLPASVLGAAPVHAPRPGLVATTNGLIVQGANLGQFAAPPALAALVAAAGGWQAAPALVGGLAAAGVLFALAIGAVERRRGIRNR